MEWELVKVKLMKEHRMLVIRYSLRSRFKVKKENRKIKIKTQKIKKIMIFKWKETFKETCTIKKKNHKAMNQRNRKKETKKWALLTMKKENKI